MINTIKGIAEMTYGEKESYLGIVNRKYIKKKLNIAFQYRNQTFFKKQYILLKEKKQLKFKESLFYIIIKNHILFQMFNLILIYLRKIKRNVVFRFGLIVHFNERTL